MKEEGGMIEVGWIKEGGLMTEEGGMIEEG